jgi:nitrate/nitrite transport system ATP-binding protein
MVVFQNYSLLPWKTVRQNVAMAVNRVLAERSAAERREIVTRNLAMVGLAAAEEKYPAELSGGMKQRVAIARALAIRPRLLLLDEPFGALDALTRGNLQEQLMGICQEAGVTTVMVTHDVDEALLLSDRVVMMTNGPEAGIGQILAVPFARPRQRLAVMEHPEYYQLRSELIGFLQQQRRLRQRRASVVPVPLRVVAPKTVRLGYLPGLDVAPLAMALERRLFDAEKLSVIPVSFANWQRLEEKLRGGDLQAAITSASTPLALNLGLGGQSPWPAITPMTVSRNGNAFCLARRIREAGVRNRAELATWLQQRSEPLHIALSQQHGIPELLLRHWLAGGGIDPEHQVRFSVMSPMTMVGALRAERIDGFIAGRFRVAQAVAERFGSVMATDLDIWSGHPEKVLTCAEGWAEDHPEALEALAAGLMRGAEPCDDGGRREEVTAVLSQPQWLGSQAALALRGQFGDEDSSGSRLPYNRYHTDRAHVPNRAEGAWLLSQFSRWGWCPFPSNRVELLARVYRPDLCDRALEQAGYAALRPDRRPFRLADGIAFDQDDPLGYLRLMPGSPQPPQAPIPLPVTTLPTLSHP